MILLLGASGYIGSAFVRAMSARAEVFRPISRRDVDYTHRDSLIKLIRDTNATFVINCAGYTGKPNVDACEAHRADCLYANAVLPAIIGEACAACELPWGHISSGCIFSGSKPNTAGFTESDEPNFCFRRGPCSFYSGCKALGEECLSSFSQVYVWRPRLPFNHIDSPRNYLSKIQHYDRLLDATNSISHLDEFVEACLKSWSLRIPFGTYNVVNSGSISTREIVSMVRKIRSIQRTFNFFRDETEFMQLAATTPRSNCILDNSKLLNTGVRMLDVRQAIESALRDWVEA